ncbi:response regulator [Pseudomonas sp. Fl5BN2]|uniref:response regulator transcription factor n=1 Tax=Pseudomonas sp. Fl5BN2 TaxID=2697652 RepID=UPI00137867F0|nr:response regulator transcription factor [Pseudomonas sp. Fl5BN2]NBF03222.1 response regulator [Pseudomonas sp. Fl5BN2]
MTDLILLEDDPILREELCEFLNESGFATESAADLKEFHHLFNPQRHRLALLDLGLPDGDALQLVSNLHQSGHHLGIVVLTARSGSTARILGLDLGADHYVTKGGDLDELVAVLTSLERRLGYQHKDQPWLLETGPRRLVPPGAPPVALSQQDLLVLRCLMTEAGQEVSRQRIVEALGEEYLHYDQRRLDTQMHRLRRNVEQASGQTLPVKTLRNAGYCFYARQQIQ